MTRKQIRFQDFMKEVRQGDICVKVEDGKLIQKRSLRDFDVVSLHHVIYKVFTRTFTRVKIKLFLSRLYMAYVFSS